MLRAAAKASMSSETLWPSTTIVCHLKLILLINSPSQKQLKLQEYVLPKCFDAFFVRFEIMFEASWFTLSKTIDVKDADQVV